MADQTRIPTRSLAATVRAALAAKEQGEEAVILTALGRYRHLDLAPYDRYFSGDMTDHDHPEDRVQDAPTRLPRDHS